MTLKKTNFYVGIGMKDGELIGHGISSQPTKFTFGTKERKSPKDTDRSKATSDNGDTFSKVFDDFVSLTGSYMSFLPITAQLAPALVRVIAEKEIAKFAKDNGVKRDDLSGENSEVYELDQRHLPEFSRRTDRVHEAGEGAKILPKILIIGLISTYDAFLASLLRVVITKQPEIVLTSQKQMTFKELLEFPSIEEARSVLIEREIETVIRNSHHEQFEWMQRHLNVKLKETLPAWPLFVELCERRNLFTHTGGIISSQYISTCKQHKVDVAHRRVGQKLGASARYYRTATETVHEIGLKLCYVLWRKFEEQDRDKADISFNSRCMELIKMRSYKLAEALLSFSCKVPKVKDEVRRMMIVNLANSIALQGRKEEANKLLASEDWSAVSDEFKICVAAARGEIGEVAQLMSTIGTRMTVEQYRQWPVFRSVRSSSQFRDTFEEVFGEPLLSASVTTTEEPGEAETTIH